MFKVQTNKNKRAKIIKLAKRKNRKPKALGLDFQMKELRGDVVFKTILRSMRKHLKTEFEKDYVDVQRRNAILKSKEELF